MSERIRREREERLRAVVARLPEATCQGEQHLKLAVRGKTFGYYMNDHHGDGIVGVALKAAPGEQEALEQADPERYYIPAYLGAKGWIGLRLDLRAVDWEEVGELVSEAYRLQAPRSLAARIGL